jgi:hypothetical protein
MPVAPLDLPKEAPKGKWERGKEYWFEVVIALLTLLGGATVMFLLKGDR